MGSLRLPAANDSKRVLRPAYEPVHARKPRHRRSGPILAGAASGEGTSPAISWENAPKATQSFFLHVHDLDLARNKTTDDQPHWVRWNIPATATSLPEGEPRGSQLPDGSYQISATGPVYRGPGAAASGPLHHYVFELYALDTKLEVRPQPTLSRPAPTS